jgi:hypothetical protein
VVLDVRRSLWTGRGDRVAGGSVEVKLDVVAAALFGV